MKLVSVIDADPSAPQAVDVEELYIEVSALITRAVVNQRTSDWPSYFAQLRELVNRVISKTVAPSLSAGDRTALLNRLLDYMAELEKKWPKLVKRP
jgi:hypothetical protein